MTESQIAAVELARSVQKQVAELRVPCKDDAYVNALEIIATMYLAEHPADDDELVTEEWANTLDGEWNGDVWKSRQSEWGLHVEFGRNSRHLFLGASAISIGPLVVVSTSPTRGDVRRLCAALGITLKETP